MLTKRQHELRIRFLEVRMFRQRVPPYPTVCRNNEVDVRETPTRIKDTISRSSGSLQNRILWHQAPPPLHRINETDVYKTTTRAEDTIFGKSYPVASGVPTPSIGLMKPMFTKRPRELRIRSLENRIPWHRVTRPPP